MTREEDGALRRRVAELEAEIERLHREREEADLTRRELEAIFRHSPGATVIVTAAGTVSAWNASAERVFGYTEEEAVGRNVDDLIADERMRVEAEQFTQAAATGVVSVITRRLRKDGQLVDVELRALPVTVDGRHVGSVAIYHDITDLQRARHNAEEQRLRYAAIFDHAPVALVTVRDDMATITSWNPAAERLFGYSAEEAIGRNVDDLVNTIDTREEGEGLSRAGLVGPVQTVTRRVRKDGQAVDVEILALPLQDEDGRPGLVAIYHDVTELLTARREADAANAAKGAFLAAMSHEIRTPMNAVIGMSGLLLDTSLDQEQRDYAETIRTSAEALLTIINDILDFSKIEAGRMELELAPFDLRSCVEGTLDLLAPQAGRKGLDLAYDIDEGVPPTVVGDVGRVRQVLLNLVNNGVKFTDHGEVVVSVTGQPPPDGDGPWMLHLTVRDTGVGIGPEAMARLFQSFSQADASISRRYGGTGLGLAISRRLAELMDGTLWAESDGAPGQGSRFHFSFQAMTRSEQLATRRADAQPAGVGGRRVLIVDDNETNRRIVAKLAERWGMLPRATGSPSEALGWVAAGEPFDVGIIDLNMPEMDGQALAAAIRRRDPGRLLPLVLFSSVSRREAEAEGTFVAHLSKPLKPSALLDVLAQLFPPSDAAGPPATEVAGADAERGAGADEARPLRVLLAEDNAVNQKLALRLLERMGYRADVAGDGLEAIAALERQAYDLVLMDVQMPELDGMEATRQILDRWPAGERPWIVAMTANAMAGDREACLAAGMDDYVSKPIRPEELAAAIERAPGRTV